MEFVIITGDQAIFDTSFPPATVIAPPGVITGTTKEKATAIVCADGDEGSVVVAGAAYFTPSFSIPGVGTLRITSLAPDQKAKKGKAGGRVVILKGSKFRAQLTVNAPAQMPTAGGPVPDPNPIYSGTGSFVTTNTKVRME